jgi:hypothetical protein
MRFEVTGTCYPEAEVPLGNIGSVQEMEFDMQVARQKEKLVEMSANINRELAALVATKGCFIQIGRGEKTLKERYLEAVSCGWRTVKEVCIQVHPGITEGSSEKERAMKSTSMFLMRLCNSSLVRRRLGKTGFEYILSVKGLRSLLFYDRMKWDEAVRTERKRILHDQMEKCVKLNNEIVPEIEQMHTCNTEIMKKLEYVAAAVAVYQTYGKIVREFTLQIIELQRAIVNGGDDSHINALVQSSLSLLKLGKVEMDMHDVWRTILGEQKQLKDLLREADLELKKQLANNQRQEMAQPKKIFRNAGLLRDLAAARKLDARKLLELWYSNKTDASSDFGKKVKELLVFVALYTGSSNSQAILKEAQTKATDRDPQTVKKAEILLESLKVCSLPKDGQTDLDNNSTVKETLQRLGKYTLTTKTPT